MLPLWDDAPNRRPAIVTNLLIATNAAVFLYSLALAVTGNGTADVLYERWALVARDFSSNPRSGEQWLTVFSSMFLHGGWLHLIGNCWFLRVFGSSVENRIGPWKFMLLYLIGGIAAAGLQIVSRLNSPVPMIGASGAISGVLGAYFVLSPGAWVFTFVPWIIPIIPLPAFIFLLAWFAIQLVNGVGSLRAGGAAGGGVAWWAHAGGFLGGALLAYWAKKNRLAKRR
jgi:membrane associated rhomboid family serine protease